MPIYNRKDTKGSFYQYGKSGAKYYYNPKSALSMKNAYFKSLQQTKAIHVNKHKIAKK
jgi:hypothetical protein